MRAVAVVAVAAFAACTGGERWGAPDAAPEGPTVGEQPRRGGWDANSGNWNGNLGSWESVTGIGMNPTWAASGTGPGTLSNPMVFGLRREPAPTLALCEAATDGVDDVVFTGSTGTTAGALGPDVLLMRGGTLAPLAMGEQVVFAARAFDGYLRNIEITARVRRVDTLAKADAAWYAWPVFELTVCESARPERGFLHLGYVSWAPMVTVPERLGESFVFHDDLVMPITTVPRPEYEGDPMVPSSVAHQTGALWFKFAFYASLPIAMGGGLPFTTSVAGAEIDNHTFLMDGALALGNASWVYAEEEDLAGVPMDQRHWFPAFFTQDGTEVAMFSVARGDGAAHGELRYPQVWGGQKIGALELTAAEMTLAASYSLDGVHGRVTPAWMGANDRLARLPTHLASGPGTFRVGRYLNGSSSRHRLFYYWQREASIAQTSWESPFQAPIVGAVVPEGQRSSQDRLRVLARYGGVPVSYLIAGESPRPPGKQDFDDGALVPPVPMPDGMPVDAAVDAPAVDAAVDAPPVDAPPVDAPAIDAQLVDAAIDAGPDADTDAATDAATDADSGPDADSGVASDAAIEGPG